MKILRIPERLTNVRLAIAKLEEAEKLMFATHISTKSIEDNLIYLRQQEKKLQEMMREGVYQSPLNSSDIGVETHKEIIKDLKIR